MAKTKKIMNNLGCRVLQKFYDKGDVLIISRRTTAKINKRLAERMHEINKEYEVKARRSWLQAKNAI